MSPMRMMARAVLNWLAMLALWCLLLADGRAVEPGHHILWEVKGRHNTVYLLGSVHMLKPEQSALPSEAINAYQHAGTLVMELDLNDTSGAATLAGNSAVTLLPEGQTLEAQLGAALYSRFKVRASALGFDPGLAAHFQPWFAALVLEQLQLTGQGFDARVGVDMQLAARAQTDGKPLIGLETLADQLGIFSSMTLAQQRDYMNSTLQETADDANETAQVVRAWQSGDTQQLERLLREGSADSPELFQKLTVDRNRRWLPRLTQMLGDDRNYLVVVGALHLIGHDGVVDLLQREGYTAVQE
jgi:uncharacterized protein